MCECVQYLDKFSQTLMIDTVGLLAGVLIADDEDPGVHERANIQAHNRAIGVKGGLGNKGAYSVDLLTRGVGEVSDQVDPDLGAERLSGSEHVRRRCHTQLQPLRHGHILPHIALQADLY